MSFLKVPCYSIDQKKWTYRTFDTKTRFIEYVETKFIIPGNYKLKYSTVFQEQANNFRRTGHYIKAVKGSDPYIRYWDREREKCTTGVIYTLHEGGETFEWYINHWHYFYLNFLKIKWKDRNNELDFPAIVDADIYFYNYILLCKLKGKIACIVKKRQFGATFKILAILVHNTWFYEAQTNKLIAYDDAYLNDDWAIISDYRDCLNEYTAWYRNFTGREKTWKQQVEKRINNKKIFKGNKSILKASNAKDNPSKAVGGPTSIAFAEEAGIFPNWGKAEGFLKPAIKLGNIITGLVIISGSVGDLKDCDPLKERAFDPEDYDILGVDNIYDEDRAGEKCCLFIPEEWAYFGDGMDKEGNSLVEKAKACMQVELAKELRKSPESEQFFRSQHPSTLGEAFASNVKARFDTALINRHLQKAQKPENRGMVIDLERQPNGKIKHKFSKKIPITHFPFKKSDLEGKTMDKEGAIICWKIPEDNPKFGTYFASIDSIDDEDSLTSESLFSIDIYWQMTETRKIVDGKEVIVVEGDKHVCTWVGRFADYKKTHERAMMMIEWYNARTLVEINKGTFKTHAIAQKKADRYLIRKEEITFVGELSINKSTQNVYGYHKDSSGKLEDYCNTVLDEFMTEEIGAINYESKDGPKTIIIRGIERTNSIFHLRQFKEYRKGKGNYDSKDSFGPLIAYCRAMRANGIIGHRDEKEEQAEELPVEPILRTPFNNLGRGTKTKIGNHRTQIFKSLR